MEVITLSAMEAIWIVGAIVCVSAAVGTLAYSSGRKVGWRTAREIKRTTPPAIEVIAELNELRDEGYEDAFVHEIGSQYLRELQADRQEIRDRSRPYIEAISLCRTDEERLGGYLFSLIDDGTIPAEVTGSGGIEMNLTIGETVQAATGQKPD